MKTEIVRVLDLKFGDRFLRSIAEPELILTYTRWDGKAPNPCFRTISVDSNGDEYFGHPDAYVHKIIED